MDKNERPFFSIIIPTYNRAGLIGAAIESVINQKFESWELIIVDDGSEDNTEEVVQSFKNDKIQYYYQKNAETATARNNGFTHAKGEYICFLDSDDWYKDNHLSVLYHEIARGGFETAFFYVGLYYFKNGQLEVRKLPERVLRNPVEHVLFYTIYPSSVCIHKDIVKEFPFDTEAFLAEDSATWARIATKYPIKQVNEYTLIFRVHDEAITHQFSKQFSIDDVEYKLDTFKKVLYDKQIYTHLGRSAVKRYISRYYYWIFYDSIERQIISYMIYFYFKFLWVYPQNVFKKKTYKALADFFVALRQKLSRTKSPVVASSEIGTK